jgi:hypothetical protein
MSGTIFFQGNSVSLLSDAFLTLVVQDQTIQTDGEPAHISGAVSSIICIDNDKKTWIYTVPSWEQVTLTQGQHVHIEGEQRNIQRLQIGLLQMH